MTNNNNLKKPYYNKSRNDKVRDSALSKDAEKKAEDKILFSTEDILLNVGGNIRRIRKIHKMSINDLANKASMSSKYLQGVEVGKRNISVTNLSKIASVLNVPTASLFIINNPDSDKSNRIFEISDKLKNYNSNQLESIEKLIVNIENMLDNK